MIGNCLLKRLLASVATIVLMMESAAPAADQARQSDAASTPSLRVSDIFALKKRCGAATAVEESYEATRRNAFGGPTSNAGPLHPTEMLAFEENPLFIYAVGESRLARGPARHLRRVFFLKPDTFVIDNHVRPADSKESVRWLLYTSGAPQITGSRVRVAEGNDELLCETLLPGKNTLLAEKHPSNRVELRHRADSAEVRFLHVLHTRSRDDRQSAARSKLVEKNGLLSLTVSTAERVFQLTLPPSAEEAGEIAVSTPDGEVLLARRPLPCGVLPHGPQGVGLLARWDSAYHGDGRPGWDTRRPSSNLAKAVEDGTLRPCRVVVLGSGPGTNAIYLAKKGFDVTAIDIAPTALVRAKEKARKAGVEVRWLLADVLAPPKLEPFELIFDRGCYHGVRRQNSAGYVKAVCRLSRAGTRLFILAGNANESSHYGPPRVKEEEIRGDFSESFEFQWLRQTQFDTMEPGGKGALAWSILLRRK